MAISGAIGSIVSSSVEKDGPATKPASTRSLVIEQQMAHPPEKLWRALTQGPLMEEWLMKVRGS
jgi:hypothetical protein